MSQVTRILLIVGFILVILGAGAGLYFVFFYTPESDISGEGGEPTVTEILSQILPDIGEGGRRQIEDEEVDRTEGTRGLPDIAGGDDTLVSSIIDTEVEAIKITGSGNSFNYYNPEDGIFYKINEDGSIEELSSKVFRGVDEVTWSGADDKAVLEFPDGSNVVYDFETDTQVTLPDEMENFDFTESGDKIAYKYNSPNPDARWLGVANSDGTGVQGINALGDNGRTVDVNWSPNNSVVATYTHSDGTNQTVVSFIGLNNENYKGLIVEGHGFEGIWSPDGAEMLYSVYHPDTDYNPSLWMSEASGENIGNNRRSIGLETWADKCTFSGSGSSVYCAVPQDLPTGAGLVPSTADELDYDIYKVTMASGLITKVATPVTDVNEGVSIERIFVSDDETVLYYQEIDSGGVYKLKLR